MKELSKPSSSNKDKKPSASSDSSSSSQQPSDNQTPQNDAGNGQTGQNVAGGGQTAQNGAGSGQAAQNGADSGQSNSSGTDSGQSSQEGTGSSQSTSKSAGKNQPAQADHKDADAKAESTGVDTETKVVEGKQEHKSVENASKPAVTMAMEDTTVLTPENLQMAKDQNLDLLLQMGKYATWSIDIDSVDMETASEVDMGIELGTEHVPTQMIADILDGNKYLEFTLAHDGPFDFRSLLQIAIDPMYEGWYANLFYYNEEEESLEFICDAIIDSRGIASFDMEHASSYIIIVSPVSMAGMTGSDTALVGDSGSHAMRWIVTGVVVGLLAIGVGCGIFFYRRKMQEEEEDEETEEDEYDEEELEEEESEEEEYEETEEEYEEPEEEEHNEIEASEEEYEEPEEEYDESEEEVYGHSDEDDWIEDEDWQEPETPEQAPVDRFADDHAEDDWIDDDEWDIGNDWIDDEEWARRKEA